MPIASHSRRINALQTSIVIAIALLLHACSTAPKHKVVPVEDLDLASIPDPTPRHEPLSKYGNPQSYVEGGRRYWTIPNAKGYVERGQASWYGPNFHEERTSSGEPYDMYAMTAAHKTLPLPTYARVTNLENNRSVVVRINDRGPFKKGRIVDLSYVAAAKLGVVKNGTATVELKVLDDGTPVDAQTTPSSEVQTSGISRPAPLPVQKIPQPEPDKPAPGPAPADTAQHVPAGSGSTLSAAEANVPPPGESIKPRGLPLPATAQAPFVRQPADTRLHDQKKGQAVYIQVGAFSNLANAERAKQKLLEVQSHPVTISPVQGRYQTLQRVQIGPFDSEAEAKKLKGTLIDLGFTGYRIVKR